MLFMLESLFGARASNWAQYLTLAGMASPIILAEFSHISPKTVVAIEAISLAAYVLYCGAADNILMAECLRKNSTRIHKTGK